MTDAPAPRNCAIHGDPEPCYKCNIANTMGVLSARAALDREELAIAAFEAVRRGMDASGDIWGRLDWRELGEPERQMFRDVAASVVLCLVGRVETALLEP